jgi:hypothetical protein
MKVETDKGEEERNLFTYNRSTVHELTVVYYTKNLDLTVETWRSEFV